ncbi:hypothetical protein TNIN_351181 [Trichonephila inaurata madagascariensis]|uniref:Uncharacterized protein n=1 Tax=Trichonephila inaurata madagascariensis TaxID=2747483 RepID=A0A8X6WRP5_9ARAC|nr:hypothetical protein TNIN_351181 [Trichonephila inaurata madagascariensis]
MCEKSVFSEVKSFASSVQRPSLDKTIPVLSSTIRPTDRYQGECGISISPVSHQDISSLFFILFYYSLPPLTLVQRTAELLSYRISLRGFPTKEGLHCKGGGVHRGGKREISAKTSVDLDRVLFRFSLGFKFIFRCPEGELSKRGLNKLDVVLKISVYPRKGNSKCINNKS